MTVFVDDTDFVLHVGDALEVLRQMPDESVHMVCTSPPYWGLRSYLDDGHDDKRHEMGSEPTPDEYVTNMVAVFREVRRVLRRDGTCWLNIGDSYATSPKGNPDALSPSLKGGGHSQRASSAHRGQRSTIVGDLKPKDLVGVPWRLAFALQQPYYTGRIKDERDRIWLASLVDTEGCIHIHKRHAGAKSHTHTLADGSTTEYARKTDTYGVMVSVDNTSKELVDRFHALVGQGSRYTHEKGVGKSNRKQTLYRITLTGQQSRELLREIYPHLVAKQREARIAYNSPSSGVGAALSWLAIKALHNGEETRVDAPAPPTLFEPGWYVRSDIIWGKPNPMPESVTDRPTKAHEYLFLLTRSPRYFYDADAIREEHAVPLHAPGNKPKFGEVQRNDFGTDRMSAIWGNGAGRNKRSVWEIATEPFAAAHFATFPQALVEPCVLAGTSERGCCPVCGAPWERETERTPMVVRPTPKREAWQSEDDHARTQVGGTVLAAATSTTTGWRPTCDCCWPCGCVKGETPHGVGWADCIFPSRLVPCTVLDPFMGSGTTALVARRLGRRTIGIELSAEYAALAATRLQQLSLLAEGAA